MEYNDLIEKHSGLVGLMIRELGLPKNIEYDDAFQEGCIGLYKGLTTYDDSSLISPLNWYCSRIKDSLIDFYKAKARKKRQIGNEPMPISQDGEGHETALADLELTEDNTTEDLLVENENFEKLIGSIQKILKPRHFEIFILYHNTGSYEEVMKVFDLSFENARKTERRIRRKLQKELNRR